MNKKIIKLGVSILLLVALLMPVHTFAENEKDDEDIEITSSRVFSSLVGGGNSPESIFDTAFYSEKDAGQNLYKYILAKTIVEPGDDALKAVASQYGLTLTEAKQTLNFDLTPLLQKNSKLTQTGAFDLMNQFFDDYEEMKEIITEQKTLQNEVEMVEIFANGDLSDSGFDLVYDLDIIEKILFLHITESDVYTGGVPTSKTPGPRAAEGIRDQYTPYPNYVTSDSALAASPQNIEASPLSELKQLLTSDDEIDRDECLSSPDLLSALSEYEDDGSDDSLDSPGNNDDDGNATTPGDPGDPDSDETDDDGDYGKVKKSSGWLKEEECKLGDHLCITLDFIYKEASGYNDSDNCIICHIEKINDLFKETLNHSLTPNKVTGNLFESGKCKKGFSLSSMLNLNIIAIPVPPLMPPNDDLIFFHAFEDEMNKFIKRYVPFASEYQFKLKDELAIAELNYSDMEQSQTEMLASIEQIKAKAEAQVAENLEKLQKAHQVESGSELFKTLSSEMSQMNMYFESFQYIINEITTPCFKTANKNDAQ